MYQWTVRLITAVLVAAAGAYGSYALIIYSDRDDAPGGMVIGVALFVGSLVLGVWIARGRTLQKPGGHR